MPYQTKIATCSYCGSRQVLKLSARGGHELACGSCGAPLHEMKWLKADRDTGAAKRSPRRPAPHGDAVAHGWHEDRHDPRKRKRRKPRKGLLREIFEEAFDVLDDIFD
jgi:DNA-directed RNA polymerase subunit RPC12/RpoP